MTWRRALLILSGAIAVVIVAAALFLAWTATTPAGLRLAARVAASLAPGLEIEAPSGTLLGRLELGRIRWTGPLRQIEAKEVVLQWRPSRLLDRLLRVEQLEIGELRVASRPDETPAQAPIDLLLPVALQVERVRIGRLGLDTLTDKGPEPGLELGAIEGRLGSDGQHHTLEARRLTTARLAVEASATLAGRPPFEVGARARIAGEERGHPFSVTLEAGGNLDDLVLKAQSASGTLSVDGEARIAVFAPQPLRRARLPATGLDPAAWVDGAPQPDLRVEAALLPSPGAPGRLQGEVSIANARPGRLDEGRMPLRTLKATLHEEDGSLRIPAFTADLVAGKIAGTGAWAQGQLQMDATLTDVDAAAWHGALKKTRLGGELKLQASDARQQVQARLRDPRFTLGLEAERSSERVRIADARLTSPGGSLMAKGELIPGSSFAFDGELNGFDPSLFADLPRARLNAALSAQGTLGDPVSLDLHFLLRDSQFAGHPIAGQGDVALKGQEAARADLSLRAGDNRLEARGGLGAAKDELTVTIDAPRLDQVGWGGALRGDVVLSGRLAALAARWRPEAGTVQASLAIASLALGDIAVSHVEATLDGRRERHRLEARAQVGEANRLSLAASGGLDDKLLWTGQIETLAWEGPTAARLAGATPLEAGAGRLVLGPATVAGADWRASIDLLRWQPGRLETRGHFDGLPAALLVPPAALTTNLRLGGEWNIDLGARAEGRVRIVRQSGDVTLREGGESFALGLERLELSADLGGQQATLAFHGAGSRAGTWDGRLVAPLRQENDTWTLARHAPWEGRLDVDAPSIAWLSPLAGENVLLEGHLQARVDLAGTPAAPATQGQVSGTGLRVRLLDYGLDLGGGTLRLDFTPDKTRLQRLELTSVASQAPRDPRIDVERLIAQPGVLSAEGEMALDNGSERIHLRAERLAVAQLPDRWVMVSGTGDLRLAEGKLAVEGEVGVDAAYLELAQAGQPTLSSDVVVRGREKKQGSAMPVRLDLNLDLGRRFYFRGSGLNSRLQGRLRLTADNAQPLRAFGSVQTVDGRFDAYGRELAIERGIVNFQGQVDNPGLNVLALRKNLSVEAGVEVSGTAKNPRVRLVSVPDVPDPEKLSWMVLGRPPGEGVGNQDADLLYTAAMALRGNQGKSPLDSLMQTLRLEELGISSGTLADSGRFPSSHVAGNFGTNGTTAAEQIATVGTRLAKNVVLSYERSLTTAENVLKLTVELTRRLSAVGRIGADNSIGLTYSLRFGGKETKPAAPGQ